MLYSRHLAICPVLNFLAVTEIFLLAFERRRKVITYRGVIKGKVVELENAVTIPDGTEVDCFKSAGFKCGFANP